MRLQAAPRYALAFAVVVIVVVIVEVVRPTGAQPAGWYNVLVTAGAVGLLIVGVGWVLVRAWRWLRRSRATRLER
jgi:protein-S-isoprenylcysteine O-methyltransferase Ste14